MVDLDYDKVLEELINVASKPDVNEFPSILDEYLEAVAKTGDTVFPWSRVKPFLRRKLELVIEDFHRQFPLQESQIQVPNCDNFDYETQKTQLLTYVDWFYAAPFTIQRLCELIVQPDKHYRRTDKFMRGLEKNIVVVSTIQPRPNKYATPETYEKQPCFRDLYPQFNTSNSSVNHLSSPTAASSTSSASLNGIDSNSHNHPPNSSGFDHGYNSGHINSSNNSSGLFYDGSTSPSSTAPHHMMNNHHHHHSGSGHHQPSLLDQMGADSGSIHGHHHGPPPPPHHLSGHHSPHLAPLQQLDSFTNVFASSTTSHLSHLTNYSPGLTERTWSSSGPTPEQRNFAMLSSQNNAEENENIVVDDEYEDDGVVDHSVENPKEPDTSEESPKFFSYSDSSSSHSESSQESSSSETLSDDVGAGEGLPLLEDDKSTELEPSKSDCANDERLEAAKKRPPISDITTESVEEEPKKLEENKESDVLEAPLTPKKIKLQESQESDTKPDEEAKLQEVEPVVEQSTQPEMLATEPVIPAEKIEEVPSVVAEEVPMEFNGVAAPVQTEMQMETSQAPLLNAQLIDRTDDVLMQPVQTSSEEAEDQVMDEPMDQE